MDLFIARDSEWESVKILGHSCPILGHFRSFCKILGFLGQKSNFRFFLGFLGPLGGLCLANTLENVYCHHEQFVNSKLGVAFSNSKRALGGKSSKMC